MILLDLRFLLSTSTESGARGMRDSVEPNFQTSLEQSENGNGRVVSFSYYFYELIISNRIDLSVRFNPRMQNFATVVPKIAMRVARGQYCPRCHPGPGVPTRV